MNKMNRSFITRKNDFRRPGSSGGIRKRGVTSCRNYMIFSFKIPGDGRKFSGIKKGYKVLVGRRE